MNPKDVSGVARDASPVGCAVRPTRRFEHGATIDTDDRLAEEVPVAIHVDGTPFAVMMASPDDLDDFARGFALTEGLVAAVNDIDRIDVQQVFEGIVVDVTMRAGALPGRMRDANSTRELPGRSGCGICGTRELEDVVRHPPPVADGPCVGADAIERALHALRERQPVNALTGAVHAAAWARTDGQLVLAREDVGRHNALDKLIGAMAQARIDPHDGFALVTSRASYEMVTKAATAGMPILVAISAPTALAVHLANACRITLAGFARPGRFNVYSRTERIDVVSPDASRTGSAPSLR